MLRSETADDPARATAALRGLRAYQSAERAPAAPAMPVVAEAGRARVRDYGGAGRAVLFVPSLINPPDVLDLGDERSLLRWLATQGVHPLLLDWGTPSAADRTLTIAGHVETMLLPLLDRLGADTALAGYCLGGTMAQAAAALRPVAGLALIASPWRFAAYPADTHAALADLWRQAQPATDAFGLLPMEVLQAAFWRLDPARTIAKYEAHGRRAPDDPASRAFVRLEDWANDGPPLTLGAARELFEGMFMRDLPGRGRWRVGGERVALRRVRAPVLQLGSTGDRIVPAATAARLGRRIGLALGHVGMIVGSRAPAQVWRPLAAWLSQLRSR